jgi:hypothetical protein
MRGGVRGIRPAAVALLFSLGIPAHAEPAPGPSTLSVYTGQGVDSDLLQLPKVMVTGSLDYQPSYFTGIGYQRPTTTPRVIERLYSLVRLDGMTTALEVVAVQHRGMQKNVELNAAVALRTPYAHVGPIRTRFGVSIGLSQAFGNPSFEDGPAGNPDRRYRFQNYNAYELEWGSRHIDGLSLVTRIHHRSGMYGLIAPRRVGSNFVTAGLRYRW